MKDLLLLDLSSLTPELKAEAKSVLEWAQAELKKAPSLMIITGNSMNLWLSASEEKSVGSFLDFPDRIITLAGCPNVFTS